VVLHAGGSFRRWEIGTGGRRILTGLMFPLFGGGSGEYARGLMAALAAQGHTVAITCPDARRFDDSVVVYPFNLPVRAVFNSHPELPDAVRFPDLEARRLVLLLEALEDALDAAIDAFRPDVVHVHHASVLAWAAQRRCSAKGVPYLVTTHGTDLLTAEADARFVAPTLAALSKAELVTVVSDHTRRRLLQVFGPTIPDSRIATIPGAVDPDRFSVTGPVHLAASRLRRLDAKVVLFCGRLSRLKGCEHLVDAARDIDAEVFVLGDGPERAALMRRAGDNDRVHFVGYVREPLLQQFYRRADVQVVPSVVDEAFGLVCVEAMASGTPVVATAVGGIPEIVADGDCGLLVEPGSAAAIAGAVNHLLDRPMLRRRMGQRARRLVEERFTWDVIAGRFTGALAQF
jgi:glycosyltransferase involved in cell wall biosynthesis